jgi:hypothetical protein
VAQRSRAHASEQAPFTPCIASLFGNWLMRVGPMTIAVLLVVLVAVPVAALIWT